MDEGLIALAVAIIGASAGAIGIIAEFVTNRIADKPTKHDIAIGKRLDEVKQADRCTRRLSCGETKSPTRASTTHAPTTAACGRRTSTRRDGSSKNSGNGRWKHRP